MYVHTIYVLVILVPYLKLLFSCIQIIRCLVLILYDKVKYLLDLDVEQVISDKR